MSFIVRKIENIINEKRVVLWELILYNEKKDENKEQGYGKIIY